MKILLTTNSWLYDIMLRSRAEWAAHGVEVCYDIRLTMHLDYLKRINVDTNDFQYDLFPDWVMRAWDQTDISDENIFRMESKYGFKFRELMIYDLSEVKFEAHPLQAMQTEEGWRRYFISTIAYYEHLMDCFSPDFIFGEGPHAMDMKILFSVSKKRGIPFFTMFGSYLENRIFFSYEREGRNIALEHFFRNSSTLSNVDYEKGRNLIDSLRRKSYVPWYQQRMRKKYRLAPSLSGFGSIALRGFRYLTRSRGRTASIKDMLDCVRNPFPKYFITRQAWHLNARYIQKICKPPDASDTYAVYFMSSQPEATTSVWAPYFENQADVIENILKSLPSPLRLYIKEHSTDLGRNGKQFYRNLLNYPGVKVIAPLAVGVDLIKHCLMLFTIGGTVGLEGILLGKPVIVFSNCYYSFFPGVKKVDRPADIAAAVDWATNDFRPDAESIDRFAAAYIRSAYECKIAYPRMEDERILGAKDNRDSFVNGILQFLTDFKTQRWADVINEDNMRPQRPQLAIN